MKILLTGATGYIGRRLLAVLMEQGHEVICCVRNKRRFEVEENWTNLEIFEVDFANPVDLTKAPLAFDVAFYLIHSMNSSIGDFEDMEVQTAVNFRNYVNQSTAKQAIYLSGIVNSEQLSEHLQSRLKVENTLREGKFALTTLRAGIIVGSGSASFEIIRDLVEKLPIMVAPNWLRSRCQPIAIRNVLQFLTGVMLRESCYNKAYDIGCKEILTYKEMLEGYAEVRGLWRRIYTLPIMTPRLSAYWLYFITSTSYNLAMNLVDSMKVDVICNNNNLAEELNIELIPYHQAVSNAFEKIEQNAVVSSWKDALSSSYAGQNLTKYLQVPKFGCYIDKKKRLVSAEKAAQIKSNIWSIGGARGWYYGDWMWKLRGFLDKTAGGVGLRRGRTHLDRIYAGDALDFWRVLVADQENRRLLLYAEMKLPGEAWLEFHLVKKGDAFELQQTATFRPYGLLGRLYWYSVLPFHYFVFNGMIDNIVAFKND